MKTMKNFLLLLGVLLGSVAFYSCLDDDDDAYNELVRNSKQAIVTIKPLSESTYYMQLDDTTTLYPSNPYFPGTLKETRAFVWYKDNAEPVDDYDYSVQLISLDTLLTKEIAPDLGTEENDSYYGTDDMALVVNGEWVRNGVGAWIEDGYITFDFLVYRSESTTIKHFINLVQANSSDPYELELRHNAYDDARYKLVRGLVSFKLDKLPDTEGETVKLKIKYKSYVTNDYNTIELDYKTKETEE